MRCKSSIPLFVLPFVLLIAALPAVAGGDGRADFDASALSAAFPGSRDMDDASVVAALQRKLPETSSVVIEGHFVVASSGSREAITQLGRRIAKYDTAMRSRHFPELERRRTIIILAEKRTQMERMATALYPALSASALPASGFYHREDRLILAPIDADDASVVHGLMHVLVQDDSPNAPSWLEEAMATLYEGSEWRNGRLTPVLDERMRLIPPEEDLDYGVFSGICDCSPVSAEQLALIRLLLVFLDERDRLTALYAVIEKQGQYTTLLQAIEAIDFDAEAWQTFAEQSVRVSQTSPG